MNRWPFAYKANALPAELYWLKLLQVSNGIVLKKVNMSKFFWKKVFFDYSNTWNLFYKYWKMLDFDIQQKIDIFKNTPSEKQKIIVVYWPTACWKTSLSIKIAKYLNTEIISTDSRQIFKYLDIWTGKVTLNEMQWIPHHMIDIVEPNESYSAWVFKQESTKIISHLHNAWKIPVLAWGTGLYIDSIIYDFDIPKIPADEFLRKTLEKEAELYGKEFVYNKLVEIDSEYAKELHPNNLNYVIRAIEVKTLTWISKKDFRTEKTLTYDTLFITPYSWDRETLYKNINIRVKQMFDDGLVEEVKNLLEKYSKNDFWLKTIWYTEVIDYLEWKISLDECLEIVRQHNRNYAKRQLTWFRKYK